MLCPSSSHQSQPVHVDKLARMTAAMEGIEREANAKACFVAAHRATAAAAAIPFCLDVNCLVALIEPHAPAAEINRLTAVVGFADEAIVAVAKDRGFTLRLDPAPDNGSGVWLVSEVFARIGIDCMVTDPRLQPPVRL